MTARRLVVLKIVFYSDAHFSTYSSILRKRGERYSYRIDNCIDSIGWAEAYAESIHADRIVIGGDFFDKSELTAEELTALKEIYFSESIGHLVLVGNHEMKTRDRTLTSAHLFDTLKGHFLVIDEPIFLDGKIHAKNYNELLLPYIPEDERKSLAEYIVDNGRPTIVYSHNDIAGVYMGNYTSKEGFDIDEIKHQCSLFVNGHLHNSSFLDNEKRICDVGNLTGQNFGEDGFRYKHCLAVIDTDKLSIELVENPYAVYFYKVEFPEGSSEESMIKKIESLKPRSCVTFKACVTDIPKLKNVLDKIYNVINYRIVSPTQTMKIEEKQLTELKSVDHISEFKSYIKSQLENTDLLDKELQEIV